MFGLTSSRRDRGPQVRELLGERQCLAGEPPDLLPDGQVVALHVRRADRAVVAVAPDPDDLQLLPHGGVSRFRVDHLGVVDVPSQGGGLVFLESFVASRRQRLQIEPLPYDERDAVHDVLLPPYHRDPFDRGLVSQAILRGLTIVTPDPLIARYPAPVLWL